MQDRARFIGLVDLAAERLGGRALATSDDFFAEMQNMLKPEAPVFIADRYTERGKWMDGWESRRKRGAGHDHCIIELGCPGRVIGLDIDTTHFLGNHPPYASVDGLRAPRGTDPEALAAGDWRPVLDQVPLLPGSQNLFIARAGDPVSHLRLNIFPDGGVARFRVYGHVEAEPERARIDPDARAAARDPDAAGAWLDLVATTSGGMTMACSDAFFGPTNNLLLPGRGRNMGDGWETRRRRGEGHDWVIIKLGAPGTPRLLEVDTNHFKGNYPDRCALDVLSAPGEMPITELIGSPAWQPAMAEKKLRAHDRNFFEEALEIGGPVTHVRLQVIPDGGVSRVRLWGSFDG